MHTMYCRKVPYRCPNNHRRSHTISPQTLRHQTYTYLFSSISSHIQFKMVRIPRSRSPCGRTACLCNPNPLRVRPSQQSLAPGHSPRLNTFPPSSWLILINTIRPLPTTKKHSRSSTAAAPVVSLVISSVICYALAVRIPHLLRLGIWRSLLVVIVRF